MSGILFAGTPEIAAPLLRSLSSSFDVVGVLTACDRSVGRSKALVPTPVKVAATELGIPVLQFESLRTPAREAVKALGADTLVSFAFGKIFGPMFLDLFPNGRFNVHPSALPCLRGPSPIQSTILNGLGESTISFQSIGLKMDEGDIWGQMTIPLLGDETTISLTDRVAKEAAAFVPALLSDVLEGRVQARRQSGEASYCAMIGRDTGVLDFSKPVRTLHAQVRACYPWPKASAHANGSDIYITGVWGGFADLHSDAPPEGSRPGQVIAYRKDRGLGIACGDGVLWVTALQLPAKRELDHRAFVNGNQWIRTAMFD